MNLKLCLGIGAGPVVPVANAAEIWLMHANKLSPDFCELKNVCLAVLE